MAGGSSRKWSLAGRRGGECGGRRDDRSSFGERRLARRGERSSWRGGHASDRRARDHGVVVDSVNVSVFEYAPVRSASEAPMACWNVTVTASLDTGPPYVNRVVGLAEPPRGANAPPVPAALAALAVSVCGSENAPLTRRPVAFGLGSATLSVASPAVEITLAVVVA